MTRILLCDTKKNYGELLDEIFNVKFIERVMQLKAMVDCQIMTIHPHMSKIIAYYDLLIYRYYSPVWNRNGEGKLQALEKEEEEEEEEEEEDDDVDDNDDDDDKKEKKQLDTGGLEKGEGVEIIVLKAVTKIKNKNKKEKDEEKKKKKMKKMMGLKMEKRKRLKKKKKKKKLKLKKKK